MPSTISVSFDGITLYSTDGSLWKLKSILGWYDGPQPRPNWIDRPQGNGFFNPGKVYRSGRAITVNGFITSPDAATAEGIDWAAVAAVDTAGEGVDLTVEDESGIKSCHVWLASSPTFEQITDNRTAFSIQFMAHDPVKYGMPQPYLAGLPTEGGGLEYELGAGLGGALYYGSNGYLGRAEIHNSGTAESYATLRVDGDLPMGFDLNIIETGDHLTYNRAIAPGDWILIDNRTGRVTINGQSDVTTYMSQIDFFTIPAKTVRTVQFKSLGGTPLGTPTLTAMFSPGYW